MTSTIESKMHSPIRELVIKTMPDEKPLNSIGLVDPRIFKGGNKIFAIQDATGLWSCKYEKGIVPDPLKQKFTNFNKLMANATGYFNKRNLEIVEIIDRHASN